MKDKGIKGIVISAMLILLVLATYYYLVEHRNDKTSEANVKSTKVQEVLLKDLDKKYPPSPKEVVKLYNLITQCFYNESYTEEELLSMVAKIRGLYDDELLSINPEDKYLENLKYDIESMKTKSMVISSYEVVSSTDVDYFTKDGFEWARLNCDYTLRVNTQLSRTTEVFLLRKDDSGHWKIYGWTLASPEDAKIDAVP